MDTIDMLWNGDIPRTRFACERLMADVNAAAEGCFAAGAKKVYVLDGHNGGDNFIGSMLHPRVLQCNSANWQQIIRSGEIQACLMVGYHAMAGTIGGFLDHTQSSKAWFNYYINGVKYGEIAQGALFAGAFGTPCVMVSGDEAACLEAKRTLGDKIKCAAIKSGTCRNQTQSIPLPQAEERIWEAARDGVLNAGQIKPFILPTPLTVRIEFYRTDYCEEKLKSKPGLRRIDARTVEWTVEKIESYGDIVS